jgi:hypothetical protein
MYLDGVNKPCLFLQKQSEKVNLMTLGVQFHQLSPRIVIDIEASSSATLPGLAQPS